LHKSRAAAAGQEAEQEVLEWHWEVGSMFDFENVCVLPALPYLSYCLVGFTSHYEAL
jgi:hypothetical protein